MKDTFKPENKNIKAIFGDTDSFYEMPIYQRPYSWDKERVERLWFDILEAYNNNLDDKEVDKNYFLGSIVVVKKDKYYEVVDGQQRLTTLIILFCVLRDSKLEELEKLEKIINRSIKDDMEEKERLILTTHLKNQTVFEKEILEKIDFTKQKKDIEENKFLQTAYYFRNLIKEAKEKGKENYIEKLDGFIKYILDKTTLIKIICFDESFAIRLFTVLNNRGLDLASVDIIKADLLGELKEEKRGQFIRQWDKLGNIIEKTNENMQGIFNLYLYYSKSKNPRKSLQEEFKDEFKKKDPEKIILDIIKFTNNYIEMDKRDDKYVSMLKYLSHSIFWKSILTTAKHDDYSHYDEIKELITQYFYQSWIAGGTASRIKQTSFNILKKIKNKEGIKEIKQEINKNLASWASYSYKNSLRENDVYNKKWLKPLLISVEYFEHDKKDFIEITRDIQTEHILPIGWKDEKLNWNEIFTEEEAKEKLNSLGNLTLLSGTKNNLASNRNFDKKQEIYEGKGVDGKTSFEITKSIIENYKVWDGENIKKRSDCLLKKIKNILDIK